ncbi:hypothetical protein LC653_43030 [Nostoc sp. CHAB 5784]|nr:hypothetical protein [Nostoc mirabile]MCC5670382.1 hypothetical protein [Nostoc mirabile CHAB5784]
MFERDHHDTDCVSSTSEAIKTNFFSAIRAFTQLELMRVQELIENWYEESEEFVSSGGS